MAMIKLCVSHIDEELGESWHDGHLIRFIRCKICRTVRKEEA